MAAPNATKKKLLDGNIDLVNDTIKVLLLDGSTAYSFDPDTHEFVNNIADGGTTGTEMSGTGYSRKTLGTKSNTQDNTDDEGVWDAADVTWSGLDAGDIQTIVIYKQVGGDDTTPGDDPVINVLDDASVADLPLTTNGSDVTVSWAGEGILNLA